MNFNFCTHILSINRNKSLLQISGKVAGCVMRTLKTLQCTHILGASRGLLCDSLAVLFSVQVERLVSEMTNHMCRVVGCKPPLILTYC